MMARACKWEAGVWMDVGMGGGGGQVEGPHAGSEMRSCLSLVLVLFF